jgi:hypothetical protein
MIAASAGAKVMLCSGAPRSKIARIRVSCAAASRHHIGMKREFGREVLFLASVNPVHNHDQRRRLRMEV